MMSLLRFLFFHISFLVNGFWDDGGFSSMLFDLMKGSLFIRFDGKCVFCLISQTGSSGMHQQGLKRAGAEHATERPVVEHKEEK